MIQFNSKISEKEHECTVMPAAYLLTNECMRGPPRLQTAQTPAAGSEPAPARAASRGAPRSLERSAACWDFVLLFVLGEGRELRGGERGGGLAERGEHHHELVARLAVDHARFAQPAEPLGGAEQHPRGQALREHAGARALLPDLLRKLVAHLGAQPGRGRGARRRLARVAAGRVLRRGARGGQRCVAFAALLKGCEDGGHPAQHLLVLLLLHQQLAHHAPRTEGVEHARRRAGALEQLVHAHRHVAHERVGGACGLLEQQRLQRVAARVEHQLRSDGHRIFVLAARRVKPERGRVVVAEPADEQQRAVAVHLPRVAARRCGGGDERAQRGTRARRVVRDEALGDVREALVDDAVVGVVLQPDPLEDGEGAQHVQKVGGQLEHVAVVLREAGHRARHLGHVDLLRAAAARQLRVERAEHLGHAGLRDGRLLRLGHEAEAHEVARDGRVVARGEVRDVLEEGDLQLALHLGGQAPVEDAQLPVVGDEEVSRVRVAVERARLEEHGEVGGQTHRAELANVALAVRRRVEALALHPLGREHALGRVLQHRPRRAHHLCERRDRNLLAKVDGRLGLELVVQLVDEAQRPLVHRGDEVSVDPSEGALRKYRGHADQVHVQRNCLENARPLHLDRHLQSAVAQPRAVDLPEARRRDGLGGELGEALGHLARGVGGLARQAQLFADRLEGLRVREGGHAVLQLRERLDVGGREQVGADGERLPDLDERGSAVGE
mmetsp:Transcript_32240/g.80287  ORF Transcript_32240/g.80287 Transcript_32240/m.80287 type:complete len:727 (-) Transcript_32240:849-3029(-)